MFDIRSRLLDQIGCGLDYFEYFTVSAGTPKLLTEFKLWASIVSTALGCQWCIYMYRVYRGYIGITDKKMEDTI